ncbi:hypothetical protein EDD37DRAFT_78321 [Exophiala viscosa]|uniref:Uncharacterized protein n=1 Tax=Exophiala viscosa TaxID=2486360 RepID=A0AAN6E254_9EURO|nr:hypothetical protein EDD36DRAFT_492918 [Exophiala viscosa]KAI1630021.1 hypothetical protein EDD37DRAFT_78321 [Exophiala viscosa]
MAEIESKPLLQIQLDMATCSDNPATERVGKHSYPWLGPEYSNGTMSFETHFQDYEIENPAVLLQQALGDAWRRFVDVVVAEMDEAVTKCTILP